ncbi:hypothetical protein [Cohnella algarum]|uniref:hypothetical protein n=1 Tax=Cohnella algarum TaxID=2044859 RepID=UPI001966F96B|nr:hypothetical protein [Cohnella algarum]MBN2980149.1 hypothetical protein [Cohnella algarum]
MSSIERVAESEPRNLEAELAESARQKLVLLEALEMYANGWIDSRDNGAAARMAIKAARRRPPAAKAEHNEIEETRDLEADLAICEAATPGPWESQEHAMASQVAHAGVAFPNWICQLWYKDEETMENHINNCRFIATARQGWPYAIRRALAAEAEVDRLRAELEKYHTGPWD